MCKDNPFCYPGPIRDPAVFCGRQRELLRMLDRLYNGQSISLVAPRRMGKTSLLLQLLHPAVQERYDHSFKHTCFVYLNCEGRSGLTPCELYTVWLEALQDALIAGGHGVEPTLTDSKSITHLTFERAIRAVTRQQIQVVFLLDEFEALSRNPHLDAGFFSGLRGLATDYSVAYVTASVMPLLELTYVQASTLSSPFFNIFVQIRLPLFSNAEAEELLTRLATKGGIRFTAPTCEFLFELAGPHPMLLQIAGFHAFELSTVTDTALDETAHQQVRHRFLVEAEPHWTYCWQRCLPQDQKTLALLPLVWQSELAAVRRLEQAGLVWQREGKMVYLSAPFRDFIRQQDVPGLLQAPPVTVDPEQHLALLRDCALAPSPTEFTLLLCLLRRAGQVVPHHELEAEVWPDVYIEDPELLKTTLRNLRRVLGEDADCIQNVRGIGYKFVGQWI